MTSRRFLRATAECLPSNSTDAFSGPPRGPHGHRVIGASSSLTRRTRSAGVESCQNAFRAEGDRRAPRPPPRGRTDRRRRRRSCPRRPGRHGWAGSPRRRFDSVREVVRRSPGRCVRRRGRRPRRPARGGDADAGRCRRASGPAGAHHAGSTPGDAGALGAAGAPPRTPAHRHSTRQLRLAPGQLARPPPSGQHVDRRRVRVLRAAPPAAMAVRAEGHGRARRRRPRSPGAPVRQAARAAPRTPCVPRARRPVVRQRPRHDRRPARPDRPCRLLRLGRDRPRPPLDDGAAS